MGNSIFSFSINKPVGPIKRKLSSYSSFMLETNNSDVYTIFNSPLLKSRLTWGASVPHIKFLISYRVSDMCP